MEVKLVNLVCIVNEGFSDAVMEIAKDNGAKGGTILSANGSASPDAMALYGINIHPEKELLLIVLSDTIANKILDTLYDKLGNNSNANGVFFTLPVCNASENILKQYSKNNKQSED